MVLGFKPQFVKPILEGTKIHTIRHDEHDRWKPGNKIHMATGVRTKDYCMFKMDKCVSVQKITIQWHWQVGPSPEPSVWIGSLPMSLLGHGAIEQIAKNDGFESVDAFFKWFNKDFEGKIIHWTDFRY